MRYKSALEEIVATSNEEIKTDSEIRSFLEKYVGKSFVLKITGDSTYVFNISSSGLQLVVNPVLYNESSDDIYLETDIERGDNLIFRGKVNLLMLGKFKWRNMTWKEVKMFKSLFERKKKEVENR